MPKTTVAVAGATGNLGMPILKTLLDAGHSVTVLSRVGGGSSKLHSHPNLLIKEVDFTSAENLIPVLQGIDVVVCCFSTTMMDKQFPLIDAATAAGVKRYIPAEFGMDSGNPKTMALPTVCAPKAMNQKYLNQKVEANPSFSWTSIANGLFLDWGLDVGFLINPKEHTATLFNGGDTPFTVTMLSDIAKAVLGVIEHRAETANRIIYIQSALTTQNKLIQYAKEKDGKDWATTVKDTKELHRECLAVLKKGGDEAELTAAIEGLCYVGTLDPDYGGDFSDRLDNQILGIEGLDEEGVKLVVHQYI